MVFRDVYLSRDLKGAHDSLNRIAFGKMGFGRHLLIKEGEVAAGENGPVGRVGGPVSLVVYSDSAPVTEQGGCLKRVLGPGLTQLEPFEGDHAMTQWEDSPGEPERDRMEALGQPDLGDFYRDADGRIYVRRRDPRIIGGWGRRDHVRVGRVAARLEPAVVPKTDVTTQEKQALPPPAEPADEAIELHNKLLGPVGGSRETAGCFVEYERRQAPPASLSDVIGCAVASLLDDRRSMS
jgi:hypothetical protein